MQEQRKKQEILEKIILKKNYSDYYNNRIFASRYFRIWRVKAIKIKEQNSNIIISKLKTKIQQFEQLKDKDFVLKMIYKKEEEIKELKESLSRCPFQLSKGEQLISVIFNSVDQMIHYSIICKNTDLFSKLVDSLYDKYPNYRKIGGYFICNSRRINEYINLKENGITNGDVIIFYSYN